MEEEKTSTGTPSRESASLDQESHAPHATQTVSMPSPRVQSEEILDGVSLPHGSEKVVSVKKRSKNAPSNAKIQPLSINTGDHRVFSTSESDLTMRKLIRREKKHYSGIYEDPKTGRMSLYNSHRKSKDARKSNALSSVLFSPNSDRRRVISCLELNAPEPADLEVIEIERMRNGENMAPASVPIVTDGKINQGTFVFPRNSSKRRSIREREIIVPVRADDPEGHEMRYSGIFVPETVKHRSGSRTHLRKSRSTSFYPSPATPMWSPFVPVAMNLCPNCMTSTCQRCRASIASPYKSSSQDVMGTAPYPYDHVADPRGSQYLMDASLVPHAHHHHHQQRHSKHRSSTYMGSRISDIDRIYHMPSRTNLLNTSIEELGSYGHETDRLVDLLEIEYASMADENGASQLSQKKLNLIVSLAREAAGATDELESMARHLKLSLDHQLGEKWHVVIGTDSFGSNLASLPGALANFKVDRLVFLIWQT